MAKRGTRSKRFFSRLYSPVHHLLSATRNISSNLVRRSGRIVNTGLGAVDSAGTAVVKHANMAVNNITGRRRKNSRKHRKMNTRKNRK